MKLTLSQIESMAGPTTLARGRNYFREGRVDILHAHAQGIHAEVRGSANKRYHTHLYTHDDVLTSDCSCPVGMDCKHGVATAYQWLEQVPASPQVDIESWLRQLDEAADIAPAPPAPAKNHMLYQLQLIDRSGSRLPLPQLLTLKGYLKKNGEWSQLRVFSPSPYDYAYLQPAYMQNVDAEILKMLGHQRLSSGFRPADETGSIVLQRALATGRLYLHDPASTAPLRLGPTRGLQWQWREEAGQWQLHAEPADLVGLEEAGKGEVPEDPGALEARETWQFIDVSPPLYLDPRRGELGLLASDMPASQLRLLLDMPPVSSAALGRVGQQLRQHFPAATLPLPEEPDILTLDTPVPHLTLVAADSGAGYRVPGALLHFRYGPVLAEAMYQPGAAMNWDSFQHLDGQDYLVKRDWEQEIACCDQLADLGLALYDQIGQHANIWTVDAETSVETLRRWRILEREALPRLADEGWEIDADADYDIPVHPVQMDLSIRDAERSWFDFELSLNLGERKLPTETLVAHWLESGAPDDLLVPTEEGWLQLDARPLQGLRDLIESLFGEQPLDGPLRLPAFRAAQLPESVELDDRAAPLTRQLAAQLREFRGLETVPVPPNLQASLRDYQQQGLNWLHFLYRHGFGGILADDMGLGKTLQTLALLQHLKDQGQLQHPALVLAPTSVAANWLREAAHFAPALRTLLLHGPGRKAHFGSIDQQDLVVSTYPLLLRDHQVYREREFSLIVLDEAQAIKNPNTKLAREVRHLRAPCRLCLSGTPLENHLGELWSLMDFALPGLLGGQQHFRRHFRSPIENHVDRERQQQLAARVAPFLLRRTKAEVVAELPPKTETIEYVELSGRQRTLYESIRVSMQKRIRDLVAKQGMARSHIAFLDALLKLRQACIDPRLVKLDKARGIRESAKLEWLREALPQLLEEGRNLLIFSQFTEVLGLVEGELKALGIDYSKLTGRTRKRQAAIDRFQQGEVRVFLISLKAGGSGLNLTAADVVIHLDPWWNPAVEAQASDRAHRIGQDKPVFIYKLIAAGTVEERIQQLQGEKRALANTLFDDTGAAGLPRDGEALLALLE
ncbi:MAG: helicase [Haliea sp.]|nr:helicase [Haliea sp.]|tara:strand:+ start:9984 stop:13214 length:3231 start_codon:yes stop_codon:yes gene_type:complete